MNDATPTPQGPATEQAVFRRRRLMVAGGIILLGAVAVLIILKSHLRLDFTPQQAVDSLRLAGPFAFFAAMTVLPALGFPLAVFNLAAGPAFAGSLGLVPVLLLASAAIALDVAIAYWIARYAMHPPLARFLAWLGYRIPEVPANRVLAFAFLVRITPGPPFCFQSWLLGLARVPFWPYMLASWSVPTTYAIAMIIGGDALMKGNLRTALLCFAAIALLGLGLKFLRSRSKR